jgi:hypothetical protein
VRFLSRLLFLGGAVAIGLYLVRAAPRDVTLVYLLPPAPGPTALDVEVRRDDEVLRRAEFRFPDGAPSRVLHPVRLPDGRYAIAMRLSTSSGPVRIAERTIDVTEDGPILVRADAPDPAH